MLKSHKFSRTLHVHRRLQRPERTNNTEALLHCKTSGQKLWTREPDHRHYTLTVRLPLCLENGEVVLLCRATPALRRRTSEIDGCIPVWTLCWGYIPGVGPSPSLTQARSHNIPLPAAPLPHGIPDERLPSRADWTADNKCGTTAIPCYAHLCLVRD